MHIVSLFCEIDDFFLAFEKYMAEHCLPTSETPEKRGRPRSLHTSEVMTLLVAFHQSGYRTFKHYYQKQVCHYWQPEFPNAVSYNRFVELMPEAFIPLWVYLYTRFGNCDGISFLDSTPLRVCDNRRISAHRVFAKQAALSKNSMGWFYGFKLHLVINTTGELLSMELTPANTDDRVPVEGFSQGLFGKLYGDRGYISKALREKLGSQGISLVYKVRKNMAPLPMSETDTLLLRKRMLIESVIKELKTQTQLEHTRQKSFKNFQVNVVSVLIAYTYLEKKPSLNLRALQKIKDLPTPVKS